MSFTTGGYIFSEDEHLTPCPPVHVKGCAGPVGGDHEIAPDYLVPEDWTVNAEGFLVAPLDWKGDLGV